MNQMTTTVTGGAETTSGEPHCGNDRPRSRSQKPPSARSNGSRKQIRPKKKAEGKGSDRDRIPHSPPPPNIANAELPALRDEAESQPGYRKRAAATHDAMAIHVRKKRAPPKVTSHAGVVTGGDALEVMSEALRTLGVRKGSGSTSDRRRQKNAVLQDADYEPTAEACRPIFPNRGKQRITTPGVRACIEDPLHIPTSPAWKEGVHYVIVGGKDVVCKFPKCKSGTFRSVERWQSHAATKHCKAEEKDGNFVSKRNLNRRKPPGQEQCSTYADLRGTIRLRWHYLKRVKLSNLTKAAAEAFKIDTAVHVPPEPTPLPLFMHLFEWVAPSLGFVAWESVLNDQHYMHMRLLLEGCVEADYVTQWAKRALDSSCNGTYSEKELHVRAQSAANQLQHSWVMDDNLPPPIKAVLQNHRKSLVSEGMKWLESERQRLLYEQEHGMEKYLVQSLCVYKQWKCQKKPTTLLTCERNLISTFMRKGMTEDAARERAAIGKEFIDSSEDESHPSYKEKQKSAAWRKVFGERVEDPIGVKEKAGDLQVADDGGGGVGQEVIDGSEDGGAGVRVSDIEVAEDGGAGVGEEVIDRSEDGGAGVGVSDIKVAEDGGAGVGEEGLLRAQSSLVGVEEMAGNEDVHVQDHVVEESPGDLSGVSEVEENVVPLAGFVEAGVEDLAGPILVRTLQETGSRGENPVHAGVAEAGVMMETGLVRHGAETDSVGCKIVEVVAEVEHTEDVTVGETGHPVVLAGVGHMESASNGETGETAEEVVLDAQDLPMLPDPDALPLDPMVDQTMIDNDDGNDVIPLPGRWPHILLPGPSVSGTADQMPPKCTRKDAAVLMAYAEVNTEEIQISSSAPHCSQERYITIQGSHFEETNGLPSSGPSINQHTLCHQYEAQRSVLSETVSPPFTIRGLGVNGSLCVPSRMNTFTSLLDSMGARNCSITPTVSHDDLGIVWSTNGRNCDHAIGGSWIHSVVTQADSENLNAHQ